MKILHVVQGYTPAIGGTELLIQKLSEQLVQRYGDQVTVFTTNAAKNCSVFWLQNEPTLPAGTEQINGVTIRRFPIFNRFGHIRHQLTKFADRAKLPFNDWFRAFFNGPLIFGMTREIAEFRADVIGASSFPFLHMHYALAGGGRSNTPVVLFGAIHPEDQWSFERPMIYRAIKQAEAYVAHSRFEQEYLIARGISPAKVSTIGAGVDLEQFAGADGREVRANCGWGDEPVIAYVGQLTRRKGIHHLLATIPHVWEKHPEAKFLLAGASGNYSDQLEQKVTQLTLTAPNSIVIKPNFPEEEKANIFSACDIFVLPSSEESFGIVFLEAWACRKPVIGVGAGATPSIVTEGVDGLLAAPGDEIDLAQVICRLLDNYQQRTQLGEAGFQKVKNNFTWDIVTDRFRQVYEGVSKPN